MMFAPSARARVRGFSFASLVFVLTLVGLVSLPASGVAQETAETAAAGTPLAGASSAVPPDAATPGAGTSLPVTAVSLFASGVGYFQHDGFVEGDADVVLTFSVDDIDDLLKSLVLQDFDGGTVSAVTYPSQDPLERILSSFSIDVSDNPPLAELVNRARGARVQVDGASSGEGTVAGVEYRSRTTDGVTEREAVLNLLTAEGLRSFPFSGIRSIRFADDALRAELDSALAVIAENRRQERKSVTIRFTGDGRRRVRVGYVRAVPVWKTSYRTVLGTDGTAQIQGWAIVENTSEADWRNVSLALVSGRPISFVMDLYSPIYTQRPRVRPEAGVAVSPPEYERDVAPSAALRATGRAAPAMESAGELFAADSFFDDASPQPAPIDLSEGVRAAAVLETGAIYRVDHPVSIPRRGAALIPIVNRSVPAERLAIYEASVLRDRPLSAVRVTNATPTQLPAGPVTVFDGASYAGDARLPELVAGEERLLGYAVELGSTVLVRTEQEPERITRVTVSGGFLEASVRDRVETRYRVERLGEESVLHLIVHPRRAGWELVSETPPVGETDSSYRFELGVEPGETRTLTVAEERVRSQRIGLSGIRDDQIVFYLEQRTVDAATERALERLRVLRGRVADRERVRRELEQEIAVIHREQERIRANVQVLESGTDLYQRYLATLSSQEDRLEQLQERLRIARTDEAEARDALRNFIESL